MLPKTANIVLDLHENEHNLVTNDLKSGDLEEIGTAGGRENLIKQAWAELLLLPSQEIDLRRIYATAEKIIQYCRTATNDEGIDWLKTQVDRHERLAVSELAVDPVSSPGRQRAHAAFAGAQAGFRFPLGCSPRDLNGMAF